MLKTVFGLILRFSAKYSNCDYSDVDKRELRQIISAIDEMREARYRRAYEEIHQLFPNTIVGVTREGDALLMFGTYTVDQLKNVVAILERMKNEE